MHVRTAITTIHLLFCQNYSTRWKMLFERRNLPTRLGLLYIRGSQRCESPQPKWCKRTSRILGRISKISSIPVTGTPTDHQTFLRQDLRSKRSAGGLFKHGGACLARRIRCFISKVWLAEILPQQWKDTTSSQFAKVEKSLWQLQWHLPACCSRKNPCLHPPCKTSRGCHRSRPTWVAIRLLKKSHHHRHDARRRSPSREVQGTKPTSPQGFPWSRKSFWYRQQTSSVNDPLKVWLSSQINCHSKRLPHEHVVVAGGLISEPFPVKAGVRQGRFLTPVICNIDSAPVTLISRHKLETADGAPIKTSWQCVWFSQASRQGAMNMFQLSHVLSGSSDASGLLCR